MSNLENSPLQYGKNLALHLQRELHTLHQNKWDIQKTARDRDLYRIFLRNARTPQINKFEAHCYSKGIKRFDLDLGHGHIQLPFQKIKKNK